MAHDRKTHVISLLLVDHWLKVVVESYFCFLVLSLGKEHGGVTPCSLCLVAHWNCDSTRSVEVYDQNLELEMSLWSDSMVVAVGSDARRSTA